jgi:hypothetical protein
MRLCQRSIMQKLGIGNAYFEDLDSKTYPDKLIANTAPEVANNRENIDEAHDSEEDTDPVPRMITYGIL